MGHLKGTIMENDVNEIASKMVRQGYLEAASAFVERFKDGEIGERRLTTIKNFWSR
jgi:hypothetical protein